jgi:hypothetical protein
MNTEEYKSFRDMGDPAMPVFRFQKEQKIRSGAGAQEFLGNAGRKTSR